MTPRCIIDNTKNIRTIAQQLGLNPAIVANRIALYQSKHDTDVMPDIDVIKEIHDKIVENRLQNVPKAAVPVKVSNDIYFVYESSIFDMEGDIVLEEDSIERNKVFIKKCVNEGTAHVFTTSKNEKYVVNKNGIMYNLEGEKIDNKSEKYNAVFSDISDVFYKTFNKETFKEITSDEVETKFSTIKSENDEETLSASMTYNLKGHEEKGKITVIADKEKNSYYINFEESVNSFSDNEKTIIYKAIADSLPVGSTLQITGIAQKQDIYDLNNYFGKYGLIKRNNTTTEIKVNSIEIANEQWTRQTAETQQDKVFLFGDNTDDRVNTHYIPKHTQTVIRGLSNAIGIDVKKSRSGEEDSFFTDVDFDLFKSQVDEAIKKAKDSGKIIVISKEGIGIEKDQTQLKRKAPKCYAYLQQQIADLVKSNKQDKTTTVNSPILKKVVDSSQMKQYKYSKNPNAENGYDISAESGNQKYNPANMKFSIIGKNKIGGVNIAGKSIKEVFEKIIKPSLNKKINYEHIEFKDESELNEYYYRNGLLPLVELWANQHQQQVVNFRNWLNNNNYTTLVDAFSSKELSIARAMSEVLSSTIDYSNIKYQEEKITDDMVPKYSDNRERLANTKVAILSRAFTTFQKEQRIKNLSIWFKRASQELLQEAIKELNTSIEASNDNIEKQKLQEDLSKLLDDDGLKNAFASRYITIPMVVDKIKAIINKKMITLDKRTNDKNKEQNDYIRTQYSLLIDEEHPEIFNALLDLSLGEIEKKTGLRIVLNDVQKGDSNETVLEGTIDDTKEDKDDLDDEDKMVAGNVGWYHVVRRENPHDSLTQKVKNILASIPREVYNKETGKYEIEKDDIGETVFLDEGMAYSTLLSNLDWMTDADDFHIVVDGEAQLPALEKLTTRFPWVNTVIDKILDLNTEDSTIIPMFYTAFRQDYINYYTIKNSKWVPCNRQMGEENAYQSIVQNYEIGNVLSGQSVFDNSKKLNLQNVEYGKDLLKKLKNDVTNGQYDDEDVEMLQNLFLMLGVQAQNFKDWLDPNFDAGEAQDIIALNSLNVIISRMSFIFDHIKESDGLHLIKHFEPQYRQIGRIIGEVTEFNKAMTFRQGTGEDSVDYPSYSAPNFVTTLLKKLLDPNKKSAEIEKYRADERFYQDGQWRNEILRIFDTVETDETSAIIVENLKKGCLYNVNYLNDIPYEDWTEELIYPNFIKIYFSAGQSKNETIHYANYNFPIFSDSPTAMFMKFTRYISNEVEGTFKEQLIPKYRELILQELTRNNWLELRREQGISTIKSFDLSREKDKDGNYKDHGKFYWFTEMNKDEQFLDELFKIQEKINNGNDSAREELNKLIDATVEKYMNEYFKKFKQNVSIYETYIRDALATDHIVRSQAEQQKFTKKWEANATKEEIEARDKLAQPIYESYEDALEEYFWNTCYVESQIIQVTTIDPAYYKNDGGIDFQKRYKEIYAAGKKLDTNSKYGKKFEHTIYIADNEIVSTILNSIREVFDIAVANKQISEMDRDAIIDKFEHINESDAQALRSLHSMRAVLDMAGQWPPKMQDAFEHIQNNQWTMDDFYIVWQSLKPFVYSITSKPIAEGEGNMLVPHQNKNSEFLLLSMYQMFAASTFNSNKLKAINRFMEDSWKRNGGRDGIDVIQFESAVKAGGQGVINLNYSYDKVLNFIKDNPMGNKVIEEAKKKLGKKFKETDYYKNVKTGLLQLLLKKEITQEQYNQICNNLEPTEEEVYNTLKKHVYLEDGSFNVNVVHTLSYSDYIIQQPTPEHLKDTEAVFGSQFRNLIVSDMPEFLADGKTPFTILVNGKEYTKQEILNLYDACIVANIAEDYERVHGVISDVDKFKQYLLDQIKSNPKYGRDMINAIDLVFDSNGNRTFQIPLDFPNIRNKIESITLAKFKNGITKQHIHGGASIMASAIGLTHQLHILTEDGSQIKSKEELELAIKNNAIRGAECYLPAYSKKFYEPFLKTKTDKDGNTYQELDIENMPLELRELVGYRIPTENKYSMLPLIIKGFLPAQNGDAIMVPADITVIAGSDFDVDKMFLMIPEFETILYDYKKAKKDFEKINNDEAVNKLLASVGLETDIETTPEEFKEWFKEHKEEYKLDKPKFKKINYKIDKNALDNTRAARNNFLIDISTGILRNKHTALNLFNPGNFDEIKNKSKIATIIRDENLVFAFKDKYNLKTNEQVWQKLQTISSDELQEFLDDKQSTRPLFSPATFVYNHKQNMVGGKLIGIYANNTTMQAKYQTTELAIKDAYTFTINGYRVKSLHEIYTERNGIKSFISKNCSYFSAASVDNVKDPVLAMIAQNEKTAYITGFMLRAGMTVEEICLLFSQPQIMRTINSIGTLSPMMMSIIIGNQLAYYKDHYHVTFSSETTAKINKGIREGNFTSEYIAKVIMDVNDISKMSQGSEMEQNIQKIHDTCAREYQLLLLMSNIVKLATDLKPSVQFSRADSPNGAIATSLAEANIQKFKVDAWQEKIQDPDFGLENCENLLIPNLIKNPNISAKELYSTIMEDKNISMRRLQVFYTAGIDLAQQTLQSYFISQSESVQDIARFINKNINTDYLGEQALNKLYKGIISWQLSKTKLFGNDGELTFKQKRDYYLFKYPLQLKKLQEANIELFRHGALANIRIKKGRIVMEDVGKTTPSLRLLLENGFETLLMSPESTDLERRLAFDLFMYAYYSEGLNFSPNSYSIFFNTQFLLNFPEILDALRNTMPNPNEFEGFTDVYAVQNDKLWKQINPSNRQITNTQIGTVDGFTIPVSMDLIHEERDYVTYVYEFIDDAGIKQTTNFVFKRVGQSTNTETGVITGIYEVLPRITNPFGGIGIYDGNTNLYDYNYTIEENDRYENLKKLSAASRKYLDKKQKSNQMSNSYNNMMAEQAEAAERDAKWHEAAMGADTIEDANIDARLEKVNEQELEVPTDSRIEDAQEAMLERKYATMLKYDVDNLAVDDISDAEIELRYSKEESQKIQTDNGGERLC